MRYNPLPNIYFDRHVGAFLTFFALRHKHLQADFPDCVLGSFSKNAPRQRIIAAIFDPFWDHFQGPNRSNLIWLFREDGICTAELRTSFHLVANLVLNSLKKLPHFSSKSIPLFAPFFGQKTCENAESRWHIFCQKKGKKSPRQLAWWRTWAVLSPFFAKKKNAKKGQKTLNFSSFSCRSGQCS